MTTIAGTNHQYLTIAEDRLAFRTLAYEKIIRADALIRSIGERHRNINRNNSGLYVKMMNRAWSYYLKVGGSLTGLNH